MFFSGHFKIEIIVLSRITEYTYLGCNMHGYFFFLSTPYMNTFIQIVNERLTVFN